MVMPDPSELDLAAMSYSRALGLITMSDPCLGLEMLANPHQVLTTMLDLCLGLVPNMVVKPKTQRFWVWHCCQTQGAWIQQPLSDSSKQQINNLIIVHFSCHERKNTNNRSLAVIQSWSVYTRCIMWKRTRLRIYLDNVWLDLTAERRFTRLFNGASAAHSLGCVEHVLAIFQIKIKKKKQRENTKTSGKFTPTLTYRFFPIKVILLNLSISKLKIPKSI